MQDLKEKVEKMPDMYVRRRWITNKKTGEEHLKIELVIPIWTSVGLMQYMKKHKDDKTKPKEFSEASEFI